MARVGAARCWGATSACDDNFCFSYTLLETIQPLLELGSKIAVGVCNTVPQPERVYENIGIVERIIIEIRSIAIEI
jgi:hypothetical protein